MIATWLVLHRELVLPGVGVAVALCAGLGHALLRLGRWGRVVAWLLAGAWAVVVLVLTLVPEAEPSNARECLVGLTLPSPGAVEAVANVALFVPLAYLAGVASRRPWRVLAAAVLCSVGIEVVQGLLRRLGRACDTNDVAMNALGALLGCVLAVASLALSRAAERRGRRDAARPAPPPGPPTASSPTPPRARS
ncbi:VanZ family protein [Aquipuribacter sp. SD81]|uniref:VanZ family protein n=1 Tax=Aquipuribacter sp. SD81 TaxID=3127703 RepID=UPI003017FE74